MTNGVVRMGGAGAKYGGIFVEFQLGIFICGGHELVSSSG